MMSREMQLAEKFLKRKYKVLAPISVYREQMQRAIQGNRDHLPERNDDGAVIAFIKSAKEKAKLKKMKADWKLLNKAA